MRMETEPDPTNNGVVKATRHNYYFISYSVFVNVIKYKLDHIRRKIETEEWDATSRASFSCPECHKQFTDLEVC
jgi:transcription initiation factor TFIIE subunit alpha